MSKVLYLNGRFLTQPLTGVQRYCHELLRAMDEIDPPVELVCLAPRQDFDLPDWRHIRLERVGRNHGNLWEQVELPRALRGGLLFSPANSGPAFYRNQAVTLHDASVFAVPQAYQWQFRLKYHFVFQMQARRARLTLTDSHFSSRELARWLRQPEERFKVMPLGGDHLERLEADESILAKNDLTDRKYLLTVASRSPHKNLVRLENVLLALEQDVLLVEVSGDFSRVFQTASLQDNANRILRAGALSDAELKALYQHATGFVMPSLYEGFGLPVLEAMSLGCPVLSSSATSLPEVGGEAVSYFDPLRVEDMSAAITRFLGDPDLQADLRQRGYEQAAGFTWKRCAQQTLDLLLPLLDL